jgi:serine/threonine protein kinase
VSLPYRPFDGDAWLGRDLPLDGGPYQIVPESAFAVAEEMAFARQGRKARVFKLRGPDGTTYALKTFYRGFSLPDYVPLTLSLQAFAEYPGLRSLRRRVIGEAEAEVVGEPGLAFAILMPWVDGVSWAGVIEARFPLDARTCLGLAVQTANVLAHMERNGLTHADVSSSNVVVTSSDDGRGVELIDVEDMYHEALGSLPYVPDGSPGYAHPRNQGRGCRNRHGDRFAGAILLTEMLTWPDPAVRHGAADVSVFEPTELCRGGAKFELVRKVLLAQSHTVAHLFERVWDSPGPSSCPRLTDWASAVGELLPSTVDSPHATDTTACPGCGRPLLAGERASHAPGCPLRSPSAPGTPDKSAFPGVPEHDAIGFIPLFED